MTRTNKLIPLELVELSGGTQQRPLDDKWIAEIVELMKDKAEFPPVDLIFDGKNHWLIDGFHRFKAHQVLGLKKIAAVVRQGNKREAIWLSFGANSKHGLQRHSGSLKIIVEAILKDNKWTKKSDIEIARHVGCTRQYVHSIRCPKDVNSLHDEPKEKPDSKPKTRKSVNSLHPSEPGPMMDMEEQNIPFDLRERWLGRVVIQEKIHQLDQLKNFVVHSIEDGNQSWNLLNLTAFEADIKNLRNRLVSALPYALCCYCGGSGCGGCHAMGFLNEASYHAAPKKGVKP